MKVGARTPDELPAPAPAPSAPDNMDVDAPQPAETPAAAPAADEVGSDAVGAVGVPAAAPAPAQAPAAETPPATALAALVVQVDEESAANSLFSELLLLVARAARPVKDQERIGDWSNAEWILATSLVEYFRNGMPPLRKGSTLRLFLAKLLNRDPMAITKKFIAEEMELGLQTFEPKDVDLAKAARTFRDQVAEFVVSQRDRPYHGVREHKTRSKNRWEARVTVPAEHRKVRDDLERVSLGAFPTKKAAACAFDAFIEDDYRFNAKYVREKSNRIKYEKDFATMDEAMKAAAEVGRLAAEEAPGRLRHRPAAAPAPAAKPRAKPAAAKSRAKRARSPIGPARASETARRAAMGPPTAVVAPPGQAAAAEPLREEQLRLVSELQIESSSSSTLTTTLLRVAEATRSQGSRKEKEWTNIESDLAEALFAQFEHGALPLEARASLRSFLGQVLNCGTGRITDQFQRRVKKKQFEPRDGFDLDELARRLQPLVEPFIQSLQARSRSASRSVSRSASVSPRAVPAPALPPPPPLPEGVPQPPANAVQPVAAPAPAAAAPGDPMTDD